MYDQNTASGIPQDAITLAMQSGYRPNPYASPWVQQNNLRQFLMMQKNIMDAQMGGPGGMASRIAPGNPMAAMPVNMQNQFNSMAPLFQSPWAPTGSQAGGPGVGSVGGPGGFSFGGLPNNMSPMLQASMQQLQQGQNNPTPSQSDLSSLTAPGMGNAAQASGGGPSSFQGQQAPGMSSGQQAPDSKFLLSGMGDVARNVIPGAGALGDVIQGLTGGGQNQGQGSNVTVNTANSPFPRTMALLSQRGGLNAVPQGVDPNAFVDNLLVKMLGGSQ